MIGLSFEPISPIFPRSDFGNELNFQEKNSYFERVPALAIGPPFSGPAGLETSKGGRPALAQEPRAWSDLLDFLRIQEALRAPIDKLEITAKLGPGVEISNFF
jgi:hypothetical protein